MTVLAWALWGLLGAFVYAAPRLLVGLGEARSEKNPIWALIGEFLVALTFGPIIGAGLGPFAASYLGRTEEHEVRAIALIVGMIANPLAPTIVRLGTGDALGRLGGIFRGDQGK